MKLNPNEIQSSTWKQVKDWAHQELARMRVQLESDKTELQTSRLRGQIATLKDLLKLDEENVKPVTESTDHLFVK
jgi:hypothetical protein